jgi:tetratricopeptide (TPR) repeat protein
MKKAGFIFLMFILAARSIAQEKPCSEIKQPTFSDSVEMQYEQKLLLAKQQYEKDTTDADAIIWYGRRIAYTGKYIEAIAIFSKGISIHPNDARFYRHRGHRYITVRCFDKAIEDLEKSAGLIKGKPDEEEPDGLPNAKNTPTSTLQSNTWYHLGLAYYLKGEFKKSEKAYSKCLLVSNNNDMYVATANWYYITLRRLGKMKKAKQLLDTVDPAKELIENKDYLNILLLYKKEADFTDPLLLLSDNKTLSSSTYGYGLAMYCLLQDRSKDNSRKVLQKIVSGNQWAAFGFIAAEAELARMK